MSTPEQRAQTMKNLNVDPHDLGSVGSSIKTIAGVVRDIYEDIKSVKTAVTEHDSWDDAGSKAFIAKFERVDKIIEPKLQSLEKLGPTTQVIANDYADTESANAGAVLM